jgi:hypothetical protein
MVELRYEVRGHRGESRHARQQNPGRSVVAPLPVCVPTVPRARPRSNVNPDRCTMRLLALPLLSAVLVVAACGSDGSAGPATATPGFSFSYADTTGRVLTFSADSGSWTRAVDPAFTFADLYASAPADLQGQVQFRLANNIPLAQPHTLPVGVHHIGDPQDIDLNFTAFLPAGVLGVADSGTITITRSDSQVLAGQVNLYLSNPSPASLFEPFHLQGAFTLTYRALGT